MRFEPIERRQAEPLGDRAALGLVGDEVEPLAVADLVEREAGGRSRRSSDLSLARASVERCGVEPFARSARSAAPHAPSASAPASSL